jgi:TonB family protein
MVHKDGKVEIVTVLDGNSLLAEAASRSVSTWQFDPYQMDGEPVDMPIQVRVTFGLSSRREPFFSADYYPDAVSPVAKDDSLPNTSTPADSIDQDSSERVYKVGEEGVTPPHLKKGSDPEYTDNARRRKIQGTVVLQCIITSTGTTRDVSVTRSLEPGLDKQAVETVRDWQFDPGTKDGSPVSVKVTIEVTFRLYHSR